MHSTGISRCIRTSSSEALPYVDANYRTIAGRDFHAMEGFSMGGFGASMITAKRTDLFSAVVEYGGALAKWENLVQADENQHVATEMYNGIEANFLPYSLWDLTAANAAALRSNVNYKMIVGDADHQYQSNTRFRDNLISLEIDPHFQILPGVEHLGGSYLTEGSGLRFLSGHFASNFQRAGDFDRDGDTDANDYTAWRSAFGSATLAADGNQNGVVDAADYLVWRNQFAGTLATSAVAARRGLCCTRCRARSWFVAGDRDGRRRAAPAAVQPHRAGASPAALGRVRADATLHFRVSMRAFERPLRTAQQMVGGDQVGKSASPPPQ